MKAFLCIGHQRTLWSFIAKPGETRPVCRLGFLIGSLVCHTAGPEPQTAPSINEGTYAVEREKLCTYRKLWLKTLAAACEKTGWRLHALAVVSTCIDLNPARAGLIRLGQERLACYRWSSCPEYLKASAERPPWFATVEKQVVAWWLCQHTTARRRRVSGRFGMGDESRATQAIRWVKQEAQAGMQELKRRLEKACETNRAVEL